MTGKYLGFDKRILKKIYFCWKAGMPWEKIRGTLGLKVKQSWFKSNRLRIINYMVQLFEGEDSPIVNQIADLPKKIQKPIIVSKEFIAQVKAYSLLGLKVPEIARLLCVPYKAFLTMMHDNAELDQAVKIFRVQSTAQVASAILKKACGMPLKRTIYSAYKGRITDVMEVTDELPPDIAAASAFLQRNASYWQNSEDLTNMNDSEPDLSMLTTEELEVFHKLSLKITKEEEEILTDGQQDTTETIETVE